MTRVLIADDEPLVANAFARLLSSDGHDVETVPDGLAALAVLTREPFDVVVSDIAMPQMTGIELLRALRRHGSTVPVVLVTGVPAVQSAIEAVELGAVRYLPKPIDPDALRRVVAVAASSTGVAEVTSAREESEKCRTQDEHELSSALSTLWMAYQPIVSWAERRVIAYEALVRNEEPKLMRPDLLFDRAEKVHRLADLGRAIRARVARDAVQLPDRACLFMNLHVRDLRDERLYDALEPLGSVAPRTVLEITERASLSAIPDLPSCIQRLRTLGFRIAVDDLGAGYAGLNSISLLQPDVVKLDMGLIRGVDSNTTNLRLVRSMIDVCRELGAKVVCEGVETAGERDALVDAGADLLQGYLFARPARPFATATL